MLLVSAMLSCLALVTSGGAARAADDCLASPNKEAPQGSHWFYHVERGTQRKCWHLGDEGKATTAPAASDAVKSEPQQAQSAAQTPVDARAEWVDVPRVAPMVAPLASIPLASAQPAPSALAGPAMTGGRSPDGAPLATIASRWPKPGEMLVADDSIPTSAPPTSAAPPASSGDDRQATASPLKPEPQSPETAGGLADYLPFALFAGVLVCLGILGWAGVRLLMARRSPNERLDPQLWTHRRNDVADDAPRETYGGAMLQMGEIPMFSEEPAEPADVTHRASAPQRSLDEEIDEIERLLAVARQASVRMPSPSLWDVPHDQPSASE
jgi:hypothetical protein